MTDYNRMNFGAVAVYQAAVVAKAAVTTLALDVLSDRTNYELGIELFSDAAGLVPVTATAGTFAIAVKTWVSPQAADAPLDDSIDATALGSVRWAARTKTVTVTPSGITGDALYYRVNVESHRGGY